MSNASGGSTTGQYKCQACGSSFNSQNELQNHNRQEHGSSGGSK
jgi:transposase-like protein